MPTFQVAYNKNTKHAIIQASGDALPPNEGGIAFVNIGTFEHADVEAGINDLEFDVNHVFYHHVRELLYKRSAANPAVTAKFPENITDMASIKISTDVGSIELGVAFSLAVGDTKQLAPTFTPEGFGEGKAVTYASSDATKATVSATGLVTAVAAGTSTITASVGGESDTVVVTVTV